MKNIAYLVLFLLAYGCTPKTTETTTSTTKPSMDQPTTEIVPKPKEAFRATPPEPGPAPKIQIGKSEQFTLANGLKVIVVENHKLPRVSYQLFVDAPDIMEGNAAGFIDMAGEMLNKGTSTKTKAEIDETVDFLGASVSTSASGVFASSLSRHNEKLMAIIADVVKNPSFPEAEFEKIKKQTLAALAQSKDSPEEISSNVSKVLGYGKNHPYGEITTEQTIENVTLEKAKAYYKKYFKPDYSYLIVVGDTDVAKTKQLINKYLGDWTKAGQIEKLDYPMPNKPNGTMLDFVDKAGAVQSVISISHPVDLKPGSEDVIKSAVANTMLGGFFQSRLNDNLRETKAYTYGARSRLVYDDKVGYFFASASVRNEVTDSSIVEFIKELNRIRTEKAPLEEVELAKSVMAGNFARSLERPETVARFALNTVRYNLPADYYATYLEKLAKVTPEDVQEMAQKYFTPGNAHIVVVGNKDKVSEKLARFATDGKLRFYDAFGNPKVEDKTVPDGITAQTVIADYLTALGGKAKLKGIKDAHVKSSATVQGMAMQMESFQKDQKKFSNQISMMGNVVQSIIFDGDRAKIGGMGGQQMLTGDSTNTFKVSALIFPEMYYDEMDFKVKLDGTEVISGKKAYKLLVENPYGDSSTEYYDMSSNLKVQSVSAEGKMEYKDYQAVDGVMFPHVMRMSGGMAPMAIEMKVEMIELNKGIDDSKFMIK